MEWLVYKFIPDKENNIYASNFQPKNLINTPLSNFLYEEKSTVPYISHEDLINALSIIFCEDNVKVILLIFF